jgi:hypothetical protein
MEVLWIDQGKYLVFQKKGEDIAFMKNPAIFYGVIAVGVIVLLVGMYYIALSVHPFHPLRAYGGLGVGVLLLIIGIVGMIMARQKAVAK